MLNCLPVHWPCYNIFLSRTALRHHNSLTVNEKLISFVESLCACYSKGLILEGQVLGSGGLALTLMVSSLLASLQAVLLVIFSYLFYKGTSN